MNISPYSKLVRSAKLVVLCNLCLFALSTSATAAPLLLNPDFESGTDGGNVPNWENGSVFPFLGDTTAAGQGVGGSKALALETFSLSIAEANSDFFNLVVGQTYNVSFSARTDALEGTYNLSSSILYPTRSQNGNTSFANLTSTFATYSYSFTAWENSGSINLNVVRVGRTGQTVFIDDVSIVEAPELDATSAALPLAIIFCVSALLSDRRRGMS